MKMLKETTENLVDFYREMASGGGLISGSYDAVHYVTNNDNSWPNFILGGKGSKIPELESITRAISGNELPPVWIRESEAPEDFEQAASRKGIRKINYWIGMEKEMKEPFPLPEKTKGIEVVLVEQQEDLDEWLEIVNTEVMTSNKINGARVINILKLEHIHFFSLKIGATLVSTVLIYIHQGIAGIYFVATRNEHRGKGYGTKVLCEAMNYCFSKGISKFVLHSTQKGIYLYNKLGFVENGKYDIYWMLGKR